MAIFKLYTKQVRGQEDHVYLYLYHLPTGEKQPTLQALKVKIPKLYCKPNDRNFKKVSKSLPNDYLLKSGFDTVEKLNSYLEEQLEKYIISNGQKDYIPKDSKTLNSWMDIILSRQLNQGTKMRYKNIKNLLEQFQRWYSVQVKHKKETELIYCNEITITYLNEFQQWLLSEPNEGEKRKKNTINSSNYKMKAIKSLINKAHFQNYYPFPNNPFDHISFSYIDKPAEILTLEELKSLIETKYDEVYRRTVPAKGGESLWGKPIVEGVEIRNKRNRRYIQKHKLDDIRNYFLFQVMSQGIRVSDLITLRWSHFKLVNDVWRINKVMVKTKQPISIMVNDKMTSIMSNYILRYSNEFNEEKQKLGYLNEEIAKLYDTLNDGFRAIMPFEHEYTKHLIKLKDKINFINHHTNISCIISEETIKHYRQYLIDKASDNRANKKPVEPVKPAFINYIKPFDLVVKEIDEHMKPLITWFNGEKEGFRNDNIPKFNILKKSRHLLILDMIKTLSQNPNTRFDFVFTLMDKKYFEDIIDDDFSRLSEDQYRKFQSIRTYLNKLLKLIAQQAGIEKRLTTHLARHSYTSLMMELGENINLFDVMSSLGHKHLSTTQTYLTRITNKKLDRLNLIISDNIDGGISLL